MDVHIPFSGIDRLAFYLIVLVLLVFLCSSGRQRYFVKTVSLETYSLCEIVTLAIRCINAALIQGAK